MAAQTTNRTPKMTPRQREGALIRWVYMDRYEVHAHTREEALLTLRQHGFVTVDEKQLSHARVSRPVQPISSDFEKGDK